MKLASQLLDRFFREAEGRTNRQIDVYYTLESLGIARARAEPALDFLKSRDLLNFFGTEIAYMTDRGVRAIVEDDDIAELPRAARDFAAPTPSRQGNPPEGTEDVNQPVSEDRPDRAEITHIDVANGREFTVVLGWRVRIGRAEGNEICIQDKRASKFHAEVNFRDGDYELVDLESANGTLINGKYVVEPVVLTHEDEIVIGRTMLLFRAPAVISEPSRPREASDPSGQVEKAASGLPPTDRPAPSSAVRVVRGEPAASGDDVEVSAADLFLKTPDEDAASPERPGIVESDAVPEERPMSTGEPIEGSGFGRAVDPASHPGGLGDPSAAEPADEPPTQHGSAPVESASAAVPPASRPSSAAPIEAPSVRRARAASETSSPPDALWPSDPGEPISEPPPGDDPAFVTVAEALVEPVELPADLEPQTVDFSDDAHTVALDRASLEPDLANPPSGEREPEDAGSGEALGTVPTPPADQTLDLDRPTLAGDELGYWADAPLSSDSHPHFSHPPGSVPQEVLESVDAPTPPGTARRRPASRPASEGRPEPAETSWVETLGLLRRHVERADLPDRARLLEAIDVISEHPYVRVALNLIDP